MKKEFFLLCIVFCLLLFQNTTALSCTTMLAGKDATADGSVIVSHSCDGLGDGRLIYIPAADYKPGDLRQVFYSHNALGFMPQWGASKSHRIVSKNYVSEYNTKDDPESIPLGYIPQVPHTYAYFDSNYGVMNEHQLSIGECTDLAKVHPLPEPGKRIFYSAELARVALERCKTAREAILLMGDLIKKYGYYGTGETLLVADPNEGWVMEMCGYDMEGTDGIWVAQRVPDNGFFVAANQFRIRNIKEDSENMMYSDNIFDVAEQKRWWNPKDGPLDWTSVYGNGEFQHPYYSLRRVWRAQSLVAPSLNLPAWVDGPYTRVYPFTIKPDQKLTVKNVFNIHRDNYEDTEFDLTKGLAAGPFGCPNRFEGKAKSVADKEGHLTTVKGTFERPLNIYRCVYTHVNQSRDWLPDTIGGLVWFGPDRPATSVLLPFYAGTTGLPACIQTADVLKFDTGSMWMAFNYVANYAMLKYSYMIKDIQLVRDKFEARAFGNMASLESKALDLWKKGDKIGAKELLTNYSNNNADAVLDAWWKLAQSLYIKYNDGYLNTKEGIAQSLFYPNWWLKAVGYSDGPISYEKPKKKKQ